LLQALDTEAMAALKLLLSIAALDRKPAHESRYQGGHQWLAEDTERLLPGCPKVPVFMSSVRKM
jgi:hypothetical protein